MEGGAVACFSCWGGGERSGEGGGKGRGGGEEDVVSRYPLLLWLVALCSAMLRSVILRFCAALGSVLGGLCWWCFDVFGWERHLSGVFLFLGRFGFFFFARACVVIHLLVLESLLGRMCEGRDGEDRGHGWEQACPGSWNEKARGPSMSCNYFCVVGRDAIHFYFANQQRGVPRVGREKRCNPIQPPSHHPFTRNVERRTQNGNSSIQNQPLTAYTPPWPHAHTPP